MNRYPATQEPLPHGGAAPSPLPRRAARHRKGPRPRWLVAGLTLASVLSATAITATVDPSAPAPVQQPDLRSAR
ncbi:hypothetical protein ACFXG6_08555 [Streptomyces roseus]|uniref:hypothetical protein n=1 Tax=Streptomyces roseus TaxID=66430 RepID=UPI00368C92B1